jgi:hypothetical protein
VLEKRLTAVDLAVIRLNKKNHCNSSSDEDTFFRIIRKADVDSSMRKMCSRNSSPGLSLNMALTTKCQRLSIIISTIRYGALMQDIVVTPRGRKDFVLEHFNRLCDQHMANSNLRTFNLILRQDTGTKSNCLSRLRTALHHKKY